MDLVTDKNRIFFLQRKLNNSLQELLPGNAERRVGIPGMNTNINVNYNISHKKWFFFRDNLKEKKFTFFVGSWKYGGEKLPYNGSISISWTGDTNNAGVFADEAGEIYLMHSGNMRSKLKIDDFFNKYQGEVKQLSIDGEDKNYALIGKMSDPDIALKVVSFFDFLKA